MPTAVMERVSETDIVPVHELSSNACQTEFELNRHIPDREVQYEYMLEVDDGRYYKTYPLNGEKYSIGRNSDFSIFIPNTYVSQHHATLSRISCNTSNSGYTYRLQDGNLSGHNSTNGIYVNGEKVDTCVLSSGDIICIGPIVKARITEIEVTHSPNEAKKNALNTTDNSILHLIQEPIVVINEECLIIDINPAALRTLKIEDSLEIISQDFKEVVFSSGWAQEFGQVISRYLNNKEPSLLGRWSECRLRRMDGEEFYAELSLSHIEGKDRPYFMVIFHDISDKKNVEEKLKFQAHHDPLTNLHNRRSFMEALQKEFTKAKTEDCYGFSIFYLDLDRFKHINDILGHEVGDAILISVAKRIQSNFRDEDIISRLGGDEFTIIIRNLVDHDVLSHIAERLVLKITEPICIRGQEINVSPSIGIVVANEKYEDAGDLLRDADFAMYQSKASSLFKFTIYDEEIGDIANRKIAIEKGLREAIKSQEFLLVYQPVFSLESNKIISFETLLRWHNSELGWISPSEFIPVAEETGLILPIGRWVLETACKQMRSWQIQNKIFEGIRVSINLSGKQIAQPLFVNDLFRIIAETELPFDSLNLEITESILMENFSSAFSKLEELKSLGVNIHLDDFGTGYSSFGYLHSLPISSLKIDKSFVDRIYQLPSCIKIIESIITLANVLGLDVIAEGVETKAQLDILKKMDCRSVQGYLISEPLDASSLESFLERFRSPAETNYSQY